MNNKKVIILGDSIAKGVVYSEDKRRYTILEDNCVKRLTRDTGVDITNLSSMGRTCADAFKTLERAELDKDTIVVLEYGGNDSDFDWSKVAAEPDGEHQPKTPLDRFQELYKQAIDLVRSHGSEPVLMSLPPICPGRYLNWICREGLSRERILHWLGEENTIYRWQEMYSQTVCAIAEETGAALIDVRSAFLKNRRIDGLICDDGIHPNARGQKLILDTCSGFLASRGYTPQPA